MSALMSAQKDTPFKIYENVAYVGKPAYIGIKRVPILYENMLWRNGESKDGPPNADSLNYWINQVKNVTGPMILDIEHWPIYTDTVTRQYMVDIANAFKIAGRTYEIGYYAMIPQRDTFAALFPWHPSFTNWKARNTFVQPIADAVDILCPSLYSLYADQQRWDHYTIENILEARRLAPNKKIIPFLWPQYHTSSDRKALQYVDPELWMHQLTTVYRMCDGVIIWRIADGEVWNPSLPWYQVTLEFMERFQS